MDRIVQMKRNPIRPESVFKEIGNVKWSPADDAFVVHTEDGATFLLSPNSDEVVTFGVHIDKIKVPKPLRRRGVATKALAALCHVADKYYFRLEGGPVGWSNDPWREQFVGWLQRFGFARDSRFAATRLDDPSAFYVRRLPKPKHRSK
jgi:hypothetical protein